MISKSLPSLLKNKRPIVSNREKIGKGGNEKRTILSFFPNIHLIKYRFDTKKELQRTLKKDRNENYSFLINLGEEFSYSFNGEELLCAKQNDLIIAQTKYTELKVSLKKNKTYEILSVKIGKEPLKMLIENCQETDYSKFLEIEKSNYFQMKANLKVMEQLEKIYAEWNDIGLIEIVGHVYVLVHLIIRQYLVRLDLNSTTRSSLMKWEATEIQKISEEIRKNPERPYTVTDISEKTGVSIPRLQLGFKEKHGMTIALFIKEMRLQQAEELLRHTDRNISEIVYSIGFSSRSYFSRIFKEKYNCTPSEYKQKIQLKDAG